MIRSHLAQLRASFGDKNLVSPNELQLLFGAQDYIGMVKFVRDNMDLELGIRVGLVNEGGVLSARCSTTDHRPSAEEV
jgi:hypothetical protein